MMDQYLDGYAQANALREVDSRLKLFLGLGSIVITLGSPSPWAPLFIAITMAIITLLLARIPIQVYLSLLLIPLSFASLSAIVILFVKGGGTPILVFSLGGSILTVTTSSANLSVLLLARTFGGMCSLFFIALSTPMIEIFSTMHSLHLPSVVIDLSMLIYHFIFLLIGEVIAIYNAQTIRHGYTSIRRSINALAMLGGVLFIRAWRQGEELILAMDARCYDGRLELIDEQRTTRPLAIASVAFYLVLCCILAWSTASLAVW